MPSSLFRYSSASKTKIIFQILDMMRFWNNRFKHLDEAWDIFWIKPLGSTFKGSNLAPYTRHTCMPSIRNWVLRKRGLGGDNSCLKFLFNFWKMKFQAKNSFLEYIFLRFGDLKNELQILKKSHLYRSTYRVKFGLKGVLNLWNVDIFDTTISFYWNDVARHLLTRL